MNHLTETDVILANQGFIAAVAERHGRGLEYDDRMMTATLGFLVAVRSFRKSLVAFRPFAEAMMIDFLKQEHMRQSEYCKVESRMSLDQPVCPGGVSVGHVFFSDGRALDDSVLLEDFLERLDDGLRPVAALYLEGFSQDEVAGILQIPRYTLTAMTDRLCDEWAVYNRACG